MSAGRSRLDQFNASRERDCRTQPKHQMVGIREIPDHADKQEGAEVLEVMPNAGIRPQRRRHDADRDQANDENPRNRATDRQHC